MDSDQYPAFIGINGFTAAYGHLVVAYGATRVPASLHAKYPCTVMGISNDNGKSFTYRLVPSLPKCMDNSTEPERFRGLAAAAMISADRTKEGRYALARQAGNRIVISITDNSGANWEPPVVAAEVPEDVRFWHRAMRYSPQGSLEMMWKAVHSGGSFDVLSSASLDGGRSFRTVRMSHEMSPACNPDRCNFMMGDDLSSMDIDSQFLYAVWGDNRAGFEGAWFGRVPPTAYKE